jgi:hypothetical protein
VFIYAHYFCLASSSLLYYYFYFSYSSMFGSSCYSFLGTSSYFFLANSHLLSFVWPMMKLSNSRNFLEYELMIMNL